MQPRILIIEDSLAYQRIIARHLSGLGEFVVAASCREARALLAGMRIDLVISDYVLPDGDAKDVILELRRSRDSTDLPVIVVTSLYDKYLACELYTIGVNASMPKILGLDFRAAVQDILETRKVVMPTSEVHAITIYMWHTKDRHYCYSPQFRHTEEGSDEETAMNQMKAWIRANLRNGIEAVSSIKDQVLYI